MGSAWPMIERCLVRQWWGYTAAQRQAIDDCWASGSVPGCIGEARAGEYALWCFVVGAVDQSPLSRRILISIKEDYIKEE